MSRRQPQSMVNYTEHGYAKIRAPDHIYQLVKDFWNENKDEAVYEMSIRGNTLINNWDAPTKMVALGNRTLKGGGFVLQQKLLNAARDVISVSELEEDGVHCCNSALLHSQAVLTSLTRCRTMQPMVLLEMDWATIG
jgi:hypothetical protein